MNAIQKKAKEVGANFRSDEFRQCEFSLWRFRNYASMGCEILPRLQRNLKLEIRNSRALERIFGGELSSDVRENKKNRQISLYVCTSPYSKFVNSLCRGTEYIGLKIPT